MKFFAFALLFPFIICHILYICFVTAAESEEEHHNHRSRHYRWRPNNAQHPPPPMRRHRYHAPYYRNRHYLQQQQQPPLFWSHQQLPLLPPTISFRARFQPPQNMEQQQHQQGPAPTATQPKVTTQQIPAVAAAEQQKQRKNEQTHLAQQKGPKEQQQQPPVELQQKQQSNNQSATDIGAEQKTGGRRPLRCARKAVDKCSAFSKCADETTAESTVQNCWPKGDDMVFDEATQECRSFMTLPDCQKDTYCASRLLGPTLLGGECSKVAIVCGVPRQQTVGTDQPFVCRGDGVLHPRDKDHCIDGRRVSVCAELFS